MKIIKKLNPIQESISKIGETKKALKEEVDKNYKIGRVLDPAAADAVDLHREFRKQGLERQANPDKDPLVKEFIDETASAKSRTKHIDVVDRKELAKVLTEAKKNKQKFKVGKSDKLGYRYFVDIFPVYGSQGALDVIEDDAEGGEVDGGEMLGESLNKGEACFKKQDGVPGYLVNDEGKEKFLRNYSEKQVKDLGFKIKKDLKEALSVKPDILLDDILNWFDDHEQAKKDLITYLRRNNYKEEDIKDLFEIDEPLEEKQVKEPLKEKKYKTPMNETEDYINAMYRAYKALKSRKNGYAAVYGYRKGEKFIPLLSIKDSQTELNKVVDALKTKEKGKTDVTVYTLFKNNLDGAEDTLRSEGLLKESLKEDYGDFDYYKEQLDELDLDDTSYDYYLEALYEVADEDPYASYKSFADVLKDAISTSRQDMEEDEDENDGLDENPKESSNKDKIRLVIDLCIDTKNRRQMSVEGIREGVLVRYFDTKEQLRDYLLTEYYEDYDEFKQEMEDAEEIDYSDGKDHVDEEIEYILGTFDDPGDGSPNVQYISINGQPAFEEYTWTYDEINDSELLEKGSQREIQKRILDDILIDDEDEYEDDTDGDDLEKILKKDDLEKIRKQLKHGKDIVWPTEEEKKAKEAKISKFRKQLKEDLYVYTSSLKDFKPAKEAEALWNEIIEEGRLDLLETSLENVFKSEGEENASIDIEGLNDLLINHPDFIRTLLSLNASYITDEDEYNEEPIYTSSVVDDNEEDPYYGDEIETIEDENDEEVINDEVEEIDNEADDIADEDEKPLEDDGEVEDKKDVKENLSSGLKLNKSLKESTDIEDELDVKEDIVKEDDTEDTALDEALANGVVKYLKENIQEKVDDKEIEKEKLYKEYTDKLIEETSKEDDEDDVVAISDDEVNEMMGLPGEKEVLQKQQETKKLEEENEKKPSGEEKIEECKDGKAQ